MSNRQCGAAATTGDTAGTMENDNPTRNAKKHWPVANSMASLLDKYRSEFAGPFAISHGNTEGYRSTTNEGGYLCLRIPLMHYI
jgi:transcription factor MYB, plant